MKRRGFFGYCILGAGLAIGQNSVVLAQSASDSEAFWQTPEYRAAYHLSAIDAAKAYALGFTGEGVRVGVLDTGIDARHPEFNGRLLPGFDLNTGASIINGANFESPDSGSPSGRTSHGTHVSGIIAANRDGWGMHGVAFDSKIMMSIYDGRSGNTDDVFNQNWMRLVDSGVSIISNSSGVNDCSYSINPPCNVTDYTSASITQSLPQTIDAMKYAADNDVLMVFATGNESQPAPDALGGMPYWVPELRDTFIAVGAVDANGNLASFSNECGVASAWCLVAPGVDVVSTVPLGTGPSGGDYDEMSGTSMATPVVSGVAALVKQAFPYFSAHDIQQVLLTTATSMGDRQKYGWGMVNAGRAVQGYGAFTSNTVINTGGTNSTFSNAIGGTGGLTKEGQGTLTLAGANTYSGDTIVNAGQLSVNGSVASNVRIGQNGTLRGIGKIDASLYSAGRLAPGNSPGTLTVAGPVTIASGATTSFDIDGIGTGTGSGSYSRLVTTGTNGTIAVDGVIVPTLRGITAPASNTYVAPLGTTFEVIRSSAGVTGGFTALTQPDASALAPSSRMDTLYADRTVSLVVTPQQYSNLAANGLTSSANANAVGASLDAVRPAAGPRTGAVFSSLYATSPQALPNALDQVAGEIHSSGSALVLEHAGQVRSVVNARTSRLANSNAETGWVSFNGAAGAFSSDRAARMNWREQSAYAGFDGISLYGWDIGTMGGLGMSRGSIGAQNASATALNADFAAYADANLGFLRANVGAGLTFSHIDTSRALDFGGANATVSTGYHRASGQVFGTLAMPLDMGNATLEPFVSGAYMATSSAAFRETGSPFALSGTVDAKNLGLALLGFNLSSEIPVGDTYVSVSSTVGWQHVFGNSLGTATQSLAGAPAFKTTGVGLSRNALVLNLGLGYELGNSMVASLNYSGHYGSTSSSSALKAKFKVSF
ncbi:S8 family serine peptidase [Rhizobium sp. L1K21]|uniref:S8 family serine peptidase n=1 Tax=Rhizobium sp. L1K21 TaxID=2954933 RepID=UPI00209302AA|nr:autotransporter serine protease [Rhizobium sp. L1K21]MCO6185587.1 S8 family serine peptidase [Rhizobium sp. L1K21]